MKDKPYEVFEHTADIGIRVKGKDLKDLFRNAGLAVFAISTHKQFTRNKIHTSIIIKQKADNLEELFINWLNELLSLSSAKGLIFHGIKINKLAGNSLEALVVGSDIANYKVNTEIKAATFHELKIKQNDYGWLAEVILDV
ncbi:MAG: archease [Candidatus Omnitrophica bacterium]|nr:archease [Candidatus Omnitrophota bacterium]